MNITEISPTCAEAESEHLLRPITTIKPCATL